MIPFPILNKTRIKPPPQVIDLQVSGGPPTLACLYVLYDNGELYAIGTNPDAWGIEITPPTNVLRKLTLIRKNCQRFWVSSNNVVTHTMDNKYTISGNRSTLDVNVGGKITGQMDITDRLQQIFGVGVDSIREVSLGSGMVVVGISGAAHATGGNQYASYGSDYGANRAYPEFKQIATGVAKFYTPTSGYCAYISGSNELFVCGLNEYGRFGSSSIGVDRPAISFVKIDDAVSNGSFYRVNTFIYKNNTLQSSGKQLNGQLGNGLNTDNSVNSRYNTQVSWGSPIIPMKISFDDSTGTGSNTSPVFIIDNKLYGTGNPSRGQFGTGLPIPTYNRLTELPSVGTGKYTHLAGTPYLTAYIRNNKLYAAGVYYVFPTELGSTFYEFTNIPLPVKDN